jgi:hypothetical protein
MMTPLLPMFTLGHTFVPPSIHAGGLRYHGVSPILSRLLLSNLIEARAYMQNEVFEAAVMFARTEGIIPAPESSHAIKAAIDEALRAKEEGQRKVILFNLSGHDHFDMSAYDAYFAEIQTTSCVGSRRTFAQMGSSRCFSGDGPFDRPFCPDCGDGNRKPRGGHCSLMSDSDGLPIQPRFLLPYR